MIQTSIRKKCGNCKHFELSPPVAPTSKTTFNGRCHRPDWPHATTVGKVCPGWKAREPEAVRATRHDQLVQALWGAFGAMTAHRYAEAREPLEWLLRELHMLDVRREKLQGGNPCK